MAEAIARGVLRTGRSSSRHDRPPTRRRRGGNCSSASSAFAASTSRGRRGAGRQILLLSVKPQTMADVLEALAQRHRRTDAHRLHRRRHHDRTFIEATSATNAGGSSATMPNTPMLVGEGMVAIAGGANASADDLSRVRQLFESAGKVIEVDEDKIDAVTAMSGSGPAYFFFLVEQHDPRRRRAGAHRRAVVDARDTDRPRRGEDARSHHADTPAELRRKVTSPGGTTHAAISHMESKAYRRSSSTPSPRRSDAGKNSADKLTAEAQRTQRIKGALGRDA